MPYIDEGRGREGVPIVSSEWKTDLIYRGATYHAPPAWPGPDGLACDMIGYGRLRETPRLWPRPYIRRAAQISVRVWKKKWGFRIRDVVLCSTIGGPFRLDGRARRRAGPGGIA